MGEGPDDGASRPAVVSAETVDDAMVLRWDDGKANAFTFEAIAGLNEGLDRALDEAGAVVIVGRPGKFSAGFDLGVIAGADRDLARDLFSRGGGLCLRLFMHPQPVVAACTGHALALGAISLLCCDIRFGADGDFKIGMNEVAIAMALPRFAAGLARERLSRRHLQVATQHARVYDPPGAADAGFVDQVMSPDQVADAAIAAAHAAIGTLHPGAFAQTRERVRGEVAATLEAALLTDTAAFA